MKRLEVFGVIGRDIRLSDFVDYYRKADNPTIVIDSPGGGLLCAFDIAAFIIDHPKPTTAIIRNAFSAASVIALACFERLADGNDCLLMTHAPWMTTQGDLREHLLSADALRDFENRLIDFMVKRLRRPEAEIRAWVQQETWFDFAGGVECGLLHGMVSDRAAIGQNRIAAAMSSLNAQRFPNRAMVAARMRTVSIVNRLRRKPNAICTL